MYRKAFYHKDLSFACTYRRKSGGRFQIRRPGHRMANKYGFVRRSRVAYEDFHKCCLLPNVVIHHIDGIVTNDNPSNLRPLWRGQHIATHRKVHHVGKPIVITGSRTCIGCGSTTTSPDIEGYPHWYKVGDGYRCKICAMTIYQREYRNRVRNK